jgi:hypothetical protein
VAAQHDLDQVEEIGEVVEIGEGPGVISRVMSTSSGAMSTRNFSSLSSTSSSSSVVCAGLTT